MVIRSPSDGVSDDTQAPVNRSSSDRTIGGGTGGTHSDVDRRRIVCQVSAGIGDHVHVILGTIGF